MMVEISKVWQRLYYHHTLNNGGKTSARNVAKKKKRKGMLQTIAIARHDLYSVSLQKLSAKTTTYGHFQQRLYSAP